MENTEYVLGEVSFFSKYENPPPLSVLEKPIQNLSNFIEFYVTSDL